MSDTAPAVGDIRDVLRLRAETLRRIRSFFENRGVLEVETPALSPAGNPDPALASITARVSALGGSRHYLHTSPEFAMKRMLAAGSGDIYQVCRVFRDGELGRWHQPEFVMLEWYRVGMDERELMDETHALVATVLDERLPDLAVQHVSYREAFEQRLGFDPHRTDAAASPELAARIRSHGIEVPGNLELDALLDLALGTIVAPALPPAMATFVHDYPATQAALAEIGRTDPPVAARFELFVDGLEIANGFRELTDAAEQRQRFEIQLASRRAAGDATPPIDEAFLAALGAGLPACAGVAVGVDRLVALAAGAASLAEVVVFPHL